MDDLIGRYGRGDESAARELYRRFGGAVRTVVRSTLNERALVDDAVQQTFLNAWRSAGSFDPDRQIAPWLYTIARRTAIDVLRHERRPTTGGHVAETDAGVDAISFEHTWELFELRVAIDGLPDGERELVRASYLEDLPHRAIAERFGIPEGTVKSRLSRALGRLADELQHLRTNQTVPRSEYLNAPTRRTNR